MKGIKTIFVSALLISSSASVYADKNSLCSEIGRMAESIMKVRQSGISMSDFLTEAVSKMKPKIVRDSAETMTLDAYSKQRWLTDESKRIEIENFRNKYELECYSELKDDEIEQLK